MCTAKHEPIAQITFRREKNRDFPPTRVSQIVVCGLMIPSCLVTKLPPSLTHSLTPSLPPSLHLASSLRILLLSDPHIQCSFDRYEPWLFRWDSDSYVSKVFSFLVSTLSPHVIVVLGDIFAEGYKASPQQWKDYLQVSAVALTVDECYAVAVCKY